MLTINMQFPHGGINNKKVGYNLRPPHPFTSHGTPNSISKILNISFGTIKCTLKKNIIKDSKRILLFKSF